MTRRTRNYAFLAKTGLIALLAIQLTPKATFGEENTSLEKAKDSVVRIYGPGAPGSGVITDHEGEMYTVLTAWHVIKGISKSESIERINT